MSKNPNYSIIQIWVKNENINISNFINKNFNYNYIYKKFN